MQALTNTVARLPAGSAIDRTRARRPWMAGALVVIAAGTALLPFAPGGAALLLVAAVLGIAQAFAFSTP